MGDFNVDFCNRHHFLYAKLSNILCSFSLTQVVAQPTHASPSGRDTLIDLALLSNPSQLMSCDVIPPLGSSDHSGISLHLKWSAGSIPGRTSKRVIWRYAHADFQKACRLINETNWDWLYDLSDVDVVGDEWEKLFMAIMDQCIPKASLPSRRNLPWMTTNIRSFMRKRNMSYRKAKRTGMRRDMDKYKTMRNMVVRLFRQSKKSYFKTLGKCGSKKFWKTVKQLRKTSKDIPTLKTTSNEASTSIRKAALLNEVCIPRILTQPCRL